MTGLSYDETILLATAAHFTLNENQLGRFMTADEEATLRDLAERLLEESSPPEDDVAFMSCPYAGCGGEVEVDTASCQGPCSDCGRTVTFDPEQVTA